MKLRVPHYYDSFVCTASECRDNCCFGGWQIEIDDETVKYYQTVEGSFGDMLRDSLDYTDMPCIKLKNGVCPFLDTDNLCRIYKEIGPEHMGFVCTRFPRFSEYYGDIKEDGIGLACEEAARLIFEDNERFHYTERNIDEEPYEDSEYDERAGRALFCIREQIYELMDNPDIGFRDKLCILINSLYEVQNLINVNDYDSIATYRLSEYTGSVKEFSEEMVKEIWYAFLEMESLNESWTEFADELINRMHPEGTDNTCGYMDMVNMFNTQSFDFCGYHKLVKYFIHRYFMKSAYDHNVFGKIQFIISSLVIIKDMDIFRYMSDNKFTLKDRLDNIHIFSREVEYSEDNLEILAEEFIFGEVFEREGLLAVVNNIF